MPGPNPIYDFLKANGLTDKDAATFEREYSDSTKAKELYAFFQSNDLTDKDFNSFYDSYLKKKEPSSPAAALGSKIGAAAPVGGTSPISPSTSTSTSPLPLFGSPKKAPTDKIGQQVQKNEEKRRAESFDDVEAVFREAIDAQSAMAPENQPALPMGTASSQDWQAEMRERNEANLQLAHQKKEALLKQKAPQLYAPVKELVQSGKAREFFDANGNFKTGKAIEYFDGVVKAKGGGSFVRDMLVATLRKEGMNFVDAEAKETVRKATDKGAKAVGQTGLLGKSLASGWYRGLSMLGNHLASKGYDNTLTRYMQGKDYEAEQLAPGQYQWNKDEWLDRATTAAGTSLGASLPTMLPAAAITIGTGGVGGVAVGGSLGFLGERAMNSGGVYDEVLKQTGDPSLAREKADEFSRKQAVTLPLYYLDAITKIKGFGPVKDMMGNVVKSTGGLKNLAYVGSEKALVGSLDFGQEVVTEFWQGYTEAQATGYQGSFSDYVNENSDTVGDVLASSIGSNVGFAAAGKIYRTLGSKTPAAKKQFYAEVVAKEGPEMAAQVIDHQLETGAISEEEAAAEKEEIAQVAQQVQSLEGLGVKGEDAKAYLALSEELQGLEAQMGETSDPTILSALKLKAEEVEADLRALVGGQGSYVKVTYPGGARQTAVLPIPHFRRLQRDGEADALIQSAEAVEVVGDEALNEELQAKKGEIGNAPGAPEGFYENEGSVSPQSPAPPIEGEREVAGGGERQVGSDEWIEGKVASGEIHRGEEGGITIPNEQRETIARKMKTGEPMTEVEAWLRDFYEEDFFKTPEEIDPEFFARKKEFEKTKGKGLRQPSDYNSIEEFKNDATPEELTELEEFEALHYKTVAFDKDNLYKPFKMTAKEKARFEELRDKYAKYYWTKQSDVSPQSPSPTPMVNGAVERGEMQAQPLQDKGEMQADFSAKGGNKIVDPKGEPIVLIHGTNSNDLQFDDGTVLYSTTDESWADTYGENKKKIVANLRNPYEIPVDSEDDFIRDENGEIMYDGEPTSKSEEGTPYSFRYLDEKAVQSLKDRGYDGVVMKTGEGANANTHVVAFDKAQVKELSDVSPQPQSATPTPLERVSEGERGETGPVNIQDIGEGFEIHRGVMNGKGKGATQGFYSYDKEGALGYANGEESGVTTAVIKPGAKVLRLVDGTTDNYDTNDTDLQAFVKIIGKKAYEGTYSPDDPTDITEVLWGNEEAVAKLRKKGIDLVVGNSMDGVAVFVVNPEAISEKGSAVSPSKKEEFREAILTALESANGSEFSEVISDISLQDSDRKTAVKNIRKGKSTVATKKVEAAIEKMWEDGYVYLNRGRGDHSESFQMPIAEFLDRLTQNDEAFQDLSQQAQNLQASLDALGEDLFTDAEEIITEVNNESPQSNELKTPSTPSQDTGTPTTPTEGSNEATGTPGGPPPTDAGSQGPAGPAGPTEATTDAEPLEKGNKALLTRLYKAKGTPQAAKEGFKQAGLSYEPQSQEEAYKIAVAILDELGLDEAVLRAQAQTFGGAVNTLIQSEALNRLAYAEEKATTPEEKMAYAQRYAEVAMALDEWARDKAGRGISALNYFYKKSPLGIVMLERAKRKQDFDEWSKPKEKSWKEFFSELMKEPDFAEQVQEEIKKERAEERREKREKVHKSIDDLAQKWADKLKAKGTGGAQKQGLGVDEVFRAAATMIKAAYDAGQAVSQIVATAANYISGQLGHDEWGRDEFTKEWTDRLQKEGSLTALDRMKQRLKKEIEDLNAQIDEGKRAPKKDRTSLELDEEARSLKDQRDSLKKLLDDIDPPAKAALTEEQKIARAKKAVEKSIADYERRIREKDTSRRGKKGPEDEALRQLKAQRDKLKATYEKMKKEQPPTDEQLAERQRQVMDRFRRRLKGLTDEQKEEVVRRSFKKIVENGGLDYDDFRAIIGEVTGRGVLSDEEAASIKELVKKTAAVEEAGKRARTERTEEALTAYYQAQLEAGNAGRDLAEIVYNKPNIVRRLTSIMQLNTLGIPALINNPIYNLWNQATLRFPVGVFNDVVDRAIALGARLVGKKYDRDYDVFQTQGEFFRKMGFGLGESWEQLSTGLNRQDYIQKEIYGQQLRPFKALRDLWRHFKGEQQLTRPQVIDKALQGTVGAPAEIVARLLNVGDKPQRFGAEGAQAAAFANALGLKEIDYRLFIEFPYEESIRAYKEQGMSEAKAGKQADYVRDAIVREGQRSTFTQDNLLNDVLNKVFGGEKNSWGQFAKSVAISPFIKIPANAFWSYYNLINPEVAILQAMYYGGKAYQTRTKGDNTSRMAVREARYWTGHAVTGIAMRAVVVAMVQAGIFAAANDDDDTKKEREGEGNFEPQGTVNLSKLRVWLSGGDPSTVKDAITVSNRWVGQWGTVGNAIARKHETMTPEQRAAQEEFWNMAFGAMEIEALKDLEQGVFANTSAILTGLDRGGIEGFQRYGVNVLGMMLNTVHPASVNQIERALLPYQSTVKADSFGGELKNQELAKSWILRKLSGQYPPAKHNIWGEKMMRENSVVEKLFGWNRVNKNNFAQPLYEDYKQSGDTRLFPSAVKPSIFYEGQEIKLNAAMAQEWAATVGRERKVLVAPFVNGQAEIQVVEGESLVSRRYQDTRDIEQKVKYLQRVYEIGMENAKQKFFNQHPELRPPEKNLIKAILSETATDLNNLGLDAQ